MMAPSVWLFPFSFSSRLTCPPSSGCVRRWQYVFRQDTFCTRSKGRACIILPERTWYKRNCNFNLTTALLTLPMFSKFEPKSHRPHVHIIRMGVNVQAMCVVISFEVLELKRAGGDWECIWLTMIGSRMELFFVVIGTVVTREVLGSFVVANRSLIR